VDNEITRKFLLALGKTFGVGDYAFNEGNQLKEEQGFKISDNTNYTLQLVSSYEELQREYTSNCRRNVRKAHHSGLEFSDDISIRELVLLKKQHDHIKQSDEHYRLLINMFSGMKEAGHGRAYAVKLGANLCAGAIFAYCNKRVHYLLSVSNEVGKDKNGMFLVIDRFIQLNAGTAICLDFEGSNNESIARFFRGFGAAPHLYQRITLDTATGKFVQKVKNGITVVRNTKRNGR